MHKDNINQKTVSIKQKHYMTNEMLVLYTRGYNREAD